MIFSTYAVGLVICEALSSLISLGPGKQLQYKKACIARGNVGVAPNLHERASVPPVAGLEKRMSVDGDGSIRDTTKYTIKADGRSTFLAQPRQEKNKDRDSPLVPPRGEGEERFPSKPPSGRLSVKDVSPPKSPSWGII
ncbi:hypothetical protein V6N11_055607 [Hibiscus sabdariffa]|uniref:Uncharacterized protein n=1 Tax=Hibiscus sabdariffa TaxID=183260 RepID=A0ABR2NR08_9ROSI